MLFNNFSRRYVVFLKNIDSAGLNRRENETAGPDFKVHGNKVGFTFGGKKFAKKIARVIKSINDRNDRDNPAKK
jgi:hypothetical protein